MASTPVGKTWAAMSTPFGWATAAVTWAGRTDSANRHPTIHLRYPNVYVRFDADTFRRALEEWEAAARRYAEVRDALTLTRHPPLPARGWESHRGIQLPLAQCRSTIPHRHNTVRVAGPAPSWSHKHPLAPLLSAAHPCRNVPRSQGMCCRDSTGVQCRLLAAPLTPTLPA